MAKNFFLLQDRRWRWSGGHPTAINIKQSGGWWLVVARLNTKLVAGLHDHIVMRGAAPSLRSLNSLISTSSDCPHARLPPSSPSPLHNKFLIGAPSTTIPRPQYSETLYPTILFSLYPWSNWSRIQCFFLLIISSEIS